MSIPNCLQDMLAINVKQPSCVGTWRSASSSGTTTVTVLRASQPDGSESNKAASARIILVALCTPRKLHHLIAARSRPNAAIANHRAFARAEEAARTPSRPCWNALQLYLLHAACAWQVAQSQRPDPRPLICSASLIDPTLGS